MKIFRHILVLLSVTLVACTPSSVPNKTLSVDIDNAMSPNQVDMFDLCTIFQPDSNILIGNIRKFLCFNSFFYIMDGEQMKVYILDKKGSQVSMIDRKGHAHNEYIDLNDIFIDETRKELYLLSRGSEKLLVYDIMGKKLLRTHSLPKHFCAMEKTDNGYVGYMGNYTEDSSHPYNFFVLNEQLEIIDEGVEINPETESRYNRDIPVFSKTMDGINMIAENDYRIYLFDNKEINVSYEIDFGDLAYPKSENIYVGDPIKQMQLDANYIKRFQRIQETSDYLFIYFMYQGQNYVSVYDKENKESLCIFLNDGIKDLFPMSFGNIVGTDNDMIISTVDADYIHDLYRGGNEHNDFDKMYPNEMKNLRHTIDKVNYNNINPYIIVYKVSHHNKI